MRHLLTSLVLVPALAAQALAGQAPAPKPSAPRRPRRSPQRPAHDPACRAPRATSPARTAAPLTDEEKTIYSLGLLMQRSLNQFDLSPAELDIIKRALTDAAAGKPAIELSEWGPSIEPFAGARRARVATREKAASATYLVKAAAEPGAVKTESGLVYREVSPARANRPRPPTT